MNDPWARPIGGSGAPAGERPEDAVEIELDDGNREHEEPAGDTNWRVVIAIATVAGIALGVAIAAAMLTGDDDADDEPERAALPSSEITAPPTLPPVAPIARPSPAAVDAPSTSTPGDPAAELPVFPSAALPGDILSRFDLDADTIEASTAQRVTIEMAGPHRFGPAFVTVEHDLASDRYRSVDGHLDLGWSQQIVVDVPGGEVFLASGVVGAEDLRWQRLDGADPAPELAEQLRSLLRSPVRSETLAVARSVEGDGAVVLDDGTVARRFEVVLPGDALPEFGAGPDRPTADVLAEAFVDEQGRLALVQLLVDIGAETELVTYRFDRNAEVTIEAPSAPPEQSVDAGATST